MKISKTKHIHSYAKVRLERRKKNENFMKKLCKIIDSENFKKKKILREYTVLSRSKETTTNL